MKHGGTRTLLLTLIAVGLVVSGIAWFYQPPRAKNLICSRCNVVLISLDAVGAKYTSVYNPSLLDTPFLKDFAEKGVVFDKAYEPSIHTVPSIAALLTGSYPWDLHVWGPAPLPKTTPTLGEVLSSYGYHTVGFSVVPWVQSFYKFDRGFEEFNGALKPNTPENVQALLDDAGNWLRKNASQKEPFFMFVALPQLGNLFSPDSSGSDQALSQAFVAANAKPGGPTKADMDIFKAVSEKNLASEDQMLKDFFAVIQNAGLLPNTIVIVTASSGQEWEVHGNPAYSVEVYEDDLHVPLIISAPNVPPMNVPQSVEVRSVASTIVDLIGAPNTYAFASESLLPLMNGSEQKDRLVLSRTIAPDASATTSERFFEKLRGAVATSSPDSLSINSSALIGNWQMIRSGGDMRLYDIATDPAETANAFTPSLIPLNAQGIVQQLVQALLQLQ